ncbi:Intracellular distribution of mitochondria [Scheffersomyces spartinae]|uniref:Clustered mitochondria protein homolog n=1 Tax=Scheffersomyces spartinae TaxID=45513 RepID=A0A9P8AHD9_9ASCO|nr:Intracellular distribution of mitochondria [Scheffersomyces spartinae]KAG7192043.1 Intracellular distribution of mitochondria [Scheffersomyces spartinae]
MAESENGDVKAAEEQIKVVTLKLAVPAFITKEVLEFPIGLTDTLVDIKQTLAVFPVTKDLTSFEFHYRDINLTECFPEETTIEAVFEELQLEVGDVIFLQVKEKAYNLAAIYDHLTRFRESIGLHFIDKISQEFGVASGASTLNNLNLTPVKEQSEPESEKSTEESESKENDDEEKPAVLELSKEELSQLKDASSDILNLTTHGFNLDQYAKFDAPTKNLKMPIKSLTVSQWSPVPALQQAKGDLMYLTLQTLENETFNITCHYSGFFVNKCSTINFNPAIKVNEKGSFNKEFLLSHLVDSLSPLFSKTLAENEETLSNATSYPESYLLESNCFLAAPWVVDPTTFKNYPDVSRSQLPLITNGVDGSDYIKEWNEDVQTIRELPTTTPNDQILREKLLHKSLHDFTEVATTTAINIIKGNVTPMNPGEPVNQHIFLKNGIFYSFNTEDAFLSTGGVEAARYASAKDLASVKILNRMNVSSISNLVTCIVDYLGKRVICQAPVPGVLSSGVDEEVPEDKVAYGLSTDGEKFVQDKSFENGLKSVAEVFHLKTHSVELENGAKSDGDLLISKDIKGIVGSDHRKYIIDLYRSTPLDIEFIEQNWNESEESSYPHKQASVRHEAVEEWWRRSVSALLKEEAERLEKEGKLEAKEGEEKPQIVLPTDKVVFNPDAFSGINESEQDREDVRTISKFIKEHLIKEFLDELPKVNPPFDGGHLSVSLHKKGINLRYLGFIAQNAQERLSKTLSSLKETISLNEKEISKRKEEEEKKKNEEKDVKEDEKKEQEEEITEKSLIDVTQVSASYEALYKTAILEMVSRAVKHLLRKLSADLPCYLMPSFVSHFHNCLLGGDVNSTPVSDVDEDLKSFFGAKSLEYSQLTTESVIDLVEKEVFIRYRFQLPNTWISEVSKLHLLREIALKFGIQWKSQPYYFTKEEFDAHVTSETTQVVENGSKKNNIKNKKKSSQTISTKEVLRSSTFVADDIVNFTPVVKDSGYRARVLDDMFETVRVHIAKDEKEVAFRYLAELITVYEQVYGRVNPEAAYFYSNLAQIYFELGAISEAANIGRVALILNERTYGFDSHEAITATINSAFFEISNKDFVNGFKLYGQAIKDLCFTFGTHPSLVVTLANMADTLAGVKAYDEAVLFYERAAELSIKLNGEYSSITGLMYYRLANLYITVKKIKDSGKLYAKCVDIFSRVLGPSDTYTKESVKYEDNIAKYLKFLDLQKKQTQQSNNKPVPVKSASGKSAPVKASKKKGKKDIQQDPEFANKSVEEILKFIEGDKKKSSSSSKKSKKRSL